MESSGIFTATSRRGGAAFYKVGEGTEERIDAEDARGFLSKEGSALLLHPCSWFGAETPLSKQRRNAFPPTVAAAPCRPPRS